MKQKAVEKNQPFNCVILDRKKRIAADDADLGRISSDSYDSFLQSSDDGLDSQDESNHGNGLERWFRESAKDEPAIFLMLLKINVNAMLDL